MPAFYRAAYALSQCAAIVAALALIWMVGHIALEIFLRFFFSTSTYVADEFVGYALAIATIWSLGYALEHDAMIRVDVLTSRLSERAERTFMSACAFVTAALISGLAWFFFERAVRMWMRGTTSASSARVPMWIVEGMITAGLAIFSLQLIAVGFRKLTGHPALAVRDPQDFAE
jgi:TRAP-type C4-dicarboxylate transport system permease small subunit